MPRIKELSPTEERKKQRAEQSERQDDRNWLKRFLFPTIEEIKCAHGLSSTALPLPVKTGDNYKLIF